MTKQKKTSNDNNILKQNDHMRNLEQTEMTITAISRPFPSILRVHAKINTNQPDMWDRPNLAVRLGVSENLTRVYTIRSFNRNLSEVEIDLIEHEDESPAMQWIHNVQVGTTTQLIGPRPHFVPNFEADKHIVMFADETALPALYSILQHWKNNISADIFVESHDGNICEYLPNQENVQIHLLQRERPDQAGKMGLLLKAAYQFKKTDHISVWAACERNEARAIRQFFLEEKSLLKKDVQVTGYWNVGLSSTILDQVRLEFYQKHLEAGKTLETFDDLDMLV
ncbi:siderophore-interacting protein [Acinetobacter gyllenbergii]|uniref:siderophore-interacting protein n=1 Tax=Acinetobacter gyllenbergii TaxID=134534 RepID=UPI003F576868